MKRIYCLLLLLCPVLTGWSQANDSKVRELEIGEQVPLITITGLHNYPSASIKLSTLKGKLVILDFWSTWCGSCLEAFPKMHALQKQFAGKLQVLLIDTYHGDDIKRVKAVFDKREKNGLNKVSLPYSLQQEGLFGYFPYKYIPHYVWIDKSGKLIAITSQFEVTADNIAKVLATGVADMHMKKDLLEFNPAVPLFVNNNGGPGGNPLYRSLLMGYIEGIGYATGIERGPGDSIVRYYGFNTKARYLLTMAYKELVNFAPNRILSDQSAESKFHYQDSNDSMYNNTWCYDLVTPPIGLENLRSIVQQDIYRSFGVYVLFQKQRMNCLVLTPTSGFGMHKTNGDTAMMELDSASPRKFIQNEPIEVLLDKVNNLPATKSTLVLLDTSITYNVDLELPANLYQLSLAELKQYFISIGLQCTETVREVDVAVITDKKR